MSPKEGDDDAKVMITRQLIWGSSRVVRLGCWNLGVQDCDYKQTFGLCSVSMAKAYDGIRTV